jgi:hypothetical protein
VKEHIFIEVQSCSCFVIQYVSLLKSLVSILLILNIVVVYSLVFL